MSKTARPPRKPRSGPSAEPPTSSTDAHQGNPFTNLDPSLHDPLTLNSLTQNGVLQEFASHALEEEDRLPSSGIKISGLSNGGGHMGMGETGDVEADAANLLAFTNADDGGLFGNGSSHPGRKPFGELLQAADRSRDGGESGDRHVSERHENGNGDGQGHDHEHEHEDGQGQDHLEDGLYTNEDGALHEEMELDPTALSLARAAVGRGMVQISRKRKYGETIEGENGELLNVKQLKKENHKEVERRRRENINEGIEQIARLLPPYDQKSGKGLLLKRAAEYMAEMTDKVTRFDEILNKKEEEKQQLRAELSTIQTQLNDENARSIRYETSWREAEDRAAISQFEVDRLKTELEGLKRRA